MCVTEGAPTPRVAVIIPTWNRVGFVVKCLESLGRLEYSAATVVVVDNGSEDGTAETVRERFPDVVLLRNQANLGYAGGNNVAMRWALARGFDYVLLVNNDTEVPPKLVSEMVAVGERDPKIGVIGCRNLLLEDTDLLWGAYGRLTYGPFLVRIVGSRRLLVGTRRPDKAEYHRVFDVDFVIGNGAMWKRSALEAVGLLDESFFAYHEDVEWCRRAREAGFRVLYAGTCAILHRGSVSSDARTGPAFPFWYFVARNSVRFVRRYANARQALRFALLCVGAHLGRRARATLVRGIGWGRVRRAGDKLSSDERHFAWGLVDGFRDRPVPFERLGLRGCAIASEDRSQASASSAASGGETLT